MTIAELREQLQEDILTYLEDKECRSDINENTMAQIVVDAFDEFECKNKIGDYKIKK